MFRLRAATFALLVPVVVIAWGACSESKPAEAPSPPTAGAPATESVTSSKSQAAPPSNYDVSSSRKPATLGEARAAFTDAENKVVALVGTAAKPVALSTDSCGVACKALASMKRATEHLCELSTDDPASCDDARARLDRATARVREVCGECTDSDG
jgi:hypothetical protein